MQQQIAKEEAKIAKRILAKKQKKKKLNVANIFAKVQNIIHHTEMESY